MRLVDSLAADHMRIRQVLARITSHIADVKAQAAEVPDWAELIVRVEKLRDYKLEVMALEDRCLLPRARAFAKLTDRRFYG